MRSTRAGRHSRRRLPTVVLFGAALLVTAPMLAGCGSSVDANNLAGGRVSAPSTSAPTSVTPTVRPESRQTSTAEAAGAPACPSVPAPSAADAVPVAGLPELTLPCLGPGGTVDLAELRGPAVVNVWASWCGPCRAELPVLAEVARATAGRVAFWGITVLDDSAAAADALNTFGVPYPSLVDATGSTRAGLRWVGPPLTLFVRADGSIAHRVPGAIPDAGTLRGLLREHLGVSS